MAIDKEISTPFDILSGLFQVKREAQVIKPSNLLEHITKIRQNHTASCDAIKAYTSSIAKGREEALAHIADIEVHQGRVNEFKFLPDALLAAEIGAAEREATLTACNEAITAINAVNGTDAMCAQLQKAITPLHELLSALQQIPNHDL